MNGNQTRTGDRLTLEVNDLDVEVLTGIYSEETKLPQPLRFSITAQLAVQDHYASDTSLDQSKNYMDLKDAAMSLPDGRHFKLIEAVADHIINRLFDQDERVLRVTVKIIKLALSENGEEIGITLSRDRQ